MSEDSSKIAELSGEFHEFKKHVSEDLSEIKADVRQLLTRQSQVTGFAKATNWMMGILLACIPTAVYALFIHKSN